MYPKGTPGGRSEIETKISTRKHKFCGYIFHASSLSFRQTKRHFSTMGNSSSTPSQQAESLIETSLRHPITIFSKRSCHYCTHAKRLITHESRNLSTSGCAVPAPLVVELDDGTYPPETVQEVLRILEARTGASTVPRVFVDGRSIGGASDTARLAGQGGLRVVLASAARCNP